MTKKYLKILSLLAIFMSFNLFVFSKDGSRVATFVNNRLSQANNETINIPSGVANITNSLQNNLSSISIPQIANSLNAGNTISNFMGWEGFDWGLQDLIAIQYGEADKAVGDLWIPPGHSAGSEALPVIILIHGGGFVSGNRGNINNAAYHLAAKHGYAVFNINYTLMGKDQDGNYIGGYNSGIGEAAEAVDWVYENSGTYNLNDENIAVIGFSAGAAIAVGLGTEYPDDIQAIVAYSPTVDFTEGFYRQPHTALRSMAASLGLNKKGAILYLMQYYDGTKKGTLDNIYNASYNFLDSSSPVNNIGEDTPPTLIFYGDDQDSGSLIQTGENFEEKLNEAGVRGETVVVEGGPHGESLMYYEHDQSIDFLNSHLE